MAPGSFDPSSLDNEAQSDWEYPPLSLSSQSFDLSVLLSVIHHSFTARLLTAGGELPPPRTPLPPSMIGMRPLPLMIGTLPPRPMIGVWRRHLMIGVRLPLQMTGMPRRPMIGMLLPTCRLHPPQSDL